MEAQKNTKPRQCQMIAAAAAARCMPHSPPLPSILKVVYD